MYRHLKELPVGVCVILSRLESRSKGCFEKQRFSDMSRHFTELFSADL